VWVGTTVEDQRRADERIPHLVLIPAVVRFLSCEPLLGPVDLAEGLGWACLRCDEEYLDADGDWRWCAGELRPEHHCGGAWSPARPKVGWVIAGGESGHGARPSHPHWFRSLRDQCVAAEVPFFFKQWGNFGPVHEPPHPVTRVGDDDIIGFANIGKKAAGRTLDGREWSQFPEVPHAGA
jgi:protein gp37